MRDDNIERMGDILKKNGEYNGDKYRYLEEKLQAKQDE